MKFSSRAFGVLLLGLIVPACGGDSGGGGESIAYGSLGFDFQQGPFDNSPAWITGRLFGFADPESTDVSWVNTTTGDAGTGADQMVEVTYWFLGYVWTEIVHEWFVIIPLAVGPNTVTVTATDTQGHTATGTETFVYSPPLPVVRITEPTAGSSYYTMESPLTLSGTASGRLPLLRVEWANDLTGASGIASGTAAWEAIVPLGMGTNTIRITAVDEAERSAAASISVDYPATNPMPTVTITGPTTTGTYSTSEAGLMVTGDSSSPFGIDHIDCVCSESASWTSSSGTTLWTFWIPLVPGTNTIQVTAVDALGGSTTITLVVTMTP
jgi:hypothetical protein